MASISIQQQSSSSLNDFTIGLMLGRGSFGSVYSCVRKQTSKKYVIKQINVQILSSEEQRDAVKEVRLMASLNHQNIVHYYDSFIDGKLLNIVMGLCDGGDLQEFLKKRNKQNKIKEPLVWHLFIQICKGMAYMHSKRILHRDLKTANIFLSNTNDPKRPKVKIGDLGVARVLDNSSSFAQTMVGTPYYLSPELCEDKPYNNKSDVWALGCVLYEMCSLTHPFEANNQGALILKIVRGKYPSLSTDEYSGALRHLVTCLLSRSPMRRPTVQQVLDLEVVRSWAARLRLDLPNAPTRSKSKSKASSREHSPRSSGERSPRLQSDSATASTSTVATTTTTTTATAASATNQNQHRRPPRRIKRNRDTNTRRRVPIRKNVNSIRGTRVRQRGGQRVISSNTNNRTNIMRSSLNRTQLGASATLKGKSVVGTKETDAVSIGNSKGNLSHHSNNQSSNGAPPGLSKQNKTSVVSRPTLAQLHARMSSRAMSLQLQEEGKSSSNNNKEETEESGDYNSSNTTAEEEDEEDEEDEEESEEEDKFVPLFVSHVDVLWRIDSFDRVKDSTDDTDTCSRKVVESKMTSSSIAIEKRIQDEKEEMQQPEELLNDMLDREDELKTKIGERLQECVESFGDEVAVVTILSTLSTQNDEEDEEDDAEENDKQYEGKNNGRQSPPTMAFIERLELVQNLLVKPDSSAEIVTNALMSVIRLASLRAELDALEMAVREVTE